MHYRVLVSSRSIQLVLDRFRSRLEAANIELVVPPVVQRLSEASLLRYIKDVDGVLAGDDFFTERVLRSATRLKVISKWGTGLDSINLAVCRELGILVTNTPDAFVNPVADSTMAYVLALARAVREVDADVRNGIWRKYAHRSLSECTIGIVGVGNIGKAVALRACACGARLLGNDPLTMPAAFLEQTHMQMVDLTTLLRKSDFVTLHCNLNRSSRNLIGEAELAAMKRSAYLINMARGGVVVEHALVAALTHKRLAGAVLDVFVEEPLPAHSELLRMQNVLLSPHCANSSPAAYEYVYHTTITNLLEGLKAYEHEHVQAAAK